MSDFFELAQTRQSCRAYAARPLEPEKIDRCIRCALNSPSACNSQPWSFITVNTPELVSRVAGSLNEAGLNKFAAECPAFVIIVEEPQNTTAKLGGKLKHQDYTSVDIGIAACHITLAATELGLGSCIIGWFNEKKLRGILGVPEEKRIRLCIALGYAKDDDPHRQKVRKPIEQALKHESY